MNLAERVKDQRINLKLTQAELAELIGITQQSLQKIEDGRTQNPRKLLELAKALNCTPEWLYSGEQNQIRDIQSQYNKSSLRPLIPFPHVLHWPNKTLLTTEIQWIATPIEVSEDAFWLKVTGDTMSSLSGLSIPENYCVLVDPECTGKNEDLVIAKMEEANEITFKKLVIDTGRTYLKPLNSNYLPTEIKMAFSIIGVVKVAMRIL